MAILFALRAAAAVSPELAAAGLERLFLSTRRHPVPRRETAWLAGAREHRVPVRLPDGETELAAWSWGDGLDHFWKDRPAVLLVHGWEGRGSQMGAFAAPLVAAGLRPVAFDAPGHGRSPGGRSSIVEMAAAVGGVARWLRDVHAVEVRGAVAHSAGSAATTVALAGLLGAGEAFPLRRLVYVAPPADPGRFLHAAGRLLGLSPEIAERTQRRIEQRFDVTFSSLAGATLAPHMQAPLLAFHDRGDREVPHDEAERLVAGWPGARLVSTDGLGHRRILREPQVVDPAVAFLSA